jgi:hypothetical protein
MIRIPLITSLIHYFKVVYSYTGKKIYILILLFLLGGVSECIGISMLLPVLDVDKAVSDQSQYTKTMYVFLESIGINITLFSLLTVFSIAFLFKGAFVYLQKAYTLYIGSNLTKDI